MQPLPIRAWCSFAASPFLWQADYSRAPRAHQQQNTAMELPLLQPLLTEQAVTGAAADQASRTVFHPARLRYDHPSARDAFPSLPTTPPTAENVLRIDPPDIRVSLLAR